MRHAASRSRDSFEGTLRHVVLFKFKEGTTSDQIEAIEQKFRSLPGRIEAIRAFEWGTDVSVEGKSHGFTHAFLVTFDGPEGRDAYLPHPAHKEFGSVVGPCVEDVLVFDFISRT